MSRRYTRNRRAFVSAGTSLELIAAIGLLLFSALIVGAWAWDVASAIKAGARLF